MAKDAKVIVDMCDKSDDGFLSSIKEYFSKTTDSKASEQPSPKHFSPLEVVHESSKMQDIKEKVVELPKTVTPVNDFEQVQKITATAMKKEVNDSDIQVMVNNSDNNTKKGIMSSITNILASKKDSLESDTPSKELVLYPIEIDDKLTGDA